MKLYLNFCKNHIEDFLDQLAMVFLKQPNTKQIHKVYLFFVGFFCLFIPYRQPSSPEFFQAFYFWISVLHDFWSALKMIWDSDSMFDWAIYEFSSLKNRGYIPNTGLLVLLSLIKRAGWGHMQHKNMKQSMLNEYYREHSLTLWKTILLCSSSEYWSLDF